MQHLRLFPSLVVAAAVTLLLVIAAFRPSLGQIESTASRRAEISRAVAVGPRDRPLSAECVATAGALCAQVRPVLHIL